MPDDAATTSTSFDFFVMNPVFQVRPFSALAPSVSVSMYLEPSACRQPVNVTDPVSTGTTADFAGVPLAGAAFAGAFAGVLVCADMSICTPTNRIAQKAVPATVMLRVISQSSSFFPSSTALAARLGERALYT